MHEAFTRKSLVVPVVLVAIVLALIAPAHASVQEPRLVADILPGPGSGLFDGASCVGPPFPVPAFILLAADDGLFFSADDGVTGPELWHVDGSSGTVGLVADIVPGAVGSQRQNCNSGAWGVRDGELLFNADDGVHGLEPWRSDGTAAGTSLIQDIRPGAGGSNAGRFIAFGETVLFSAGGPEGTAGTEFWRLEDGGASLLLDIRPGDEGSLPFRLAIRGDTLFFEADDGIHGREIWRTDGSPAGTMLVEDLTPGTAGTEISGSVPFADGMAFATTYRPNFGLYRTAADHGGVTLLREFDLEPYSGSIVTQLRAVDGGFIFFVRDFSGPYELWRSDGTVAGTTRVAGIEFDQSPLTFRSVNGVALFSATTAESGQELWRSDGTAEGTRMLREFSPGAESTIFRWSVPTSGGMLFAAQTGGEAPQLWFTNGSETGTLPQGPLCPSATNCRPIQPALVGSTLYYGADDGVHGRELWARDVTVGSAAAIPTLDHLGLMLLGTVLALCALRALRR